MCCNCVCSSVRISASVPAYRSSAFCQTTVVVDNTPARWWSSCTDAECVNTSTCANVTSTSHLVPVHGLAQACKSTAIRIQPGNFQPCPCPSHLMTTAQREEVLRRFLPPSIPKKKSKRKAVKLMPLFTSSSCSKNTKQTDNKPPWLVLHTQHSILPYEKGEWDNQQMALFNERNHRNSHTTMRCSTTKQLYSQVITRPIY